jgi:hypothetical protein
MIEDTMIQRIFEPKRCKYRKDGEKNRFHNFYSSSFIITVIKTRRMKWTGACGTFEKMRHVSNILECLNGRHHVGDLGEKSG